MRAVGPGGVWAAGRVSPPRRPRRRARRPGADAKDAMIGNSPEYDAFVAKFKARHTSDDTFTPENVYNCVRDWAVRKYRLEGAAILRPFWPGGDYRAADYPEGSVVIDNPPFSILSQVVRFYNDRGVRYFLFCNGLTAFSLVRDRRAAAERVAAERAAAKRLTLPRGSSCEGLEPQERGGI